MKFSIFIIIVIFIVGGIISFVIPQNNVHVFHSPIQTDSISSSTATLTLHKTMSTKEIRIPIFIYHSVRPYRPGETAEQDTYDITPELFEAQLKYLDEHGYTPINLDQLVEITNAGNVGAIKKPVVLTFDDGLQNQYEYAFPLLKKYHMRATFYVYTHAMDVNPHFMTWAELQEMDAAGMSIESHSITHPYLFKLNAEDLHTEMADSKKTLEEHLGKPVLHFAAPFGIITDMISAEAARDGYITARAIEGPRPITQKNLLHLPGVIVSDSFERFVHELGN